MGRVDSREKGRVGEFMLGGRRRGNLEMSGLNLALKQASLRESTVA